MLGIKRKASSETLLILLLLSMLTLALNIQPVKAEAGSTLYPWPMFHHDSAHTGVSPSPAPDTNDTIWTFSTGDRVISSPAVVNGKVFVGGSFALDQFDGSLLWTSSGSIWSSPAVDSEKVFITGKNNTYALDENTGTILWKRNLGCEFSSPTVEDGLVFVGDWNGIYALDENTGATVWSYSVPHVLCSPAVAYGMVYFVTWVSGGNWLITLDMYTGNHVWTLNCSGAFFGSPAISDGTVFVGMTWEGKLYAIDAYNGSIIWEGQQISDIFSTPAVAYGKVFIGSCDRSVHAFNKSNGDLIWSFTTGDTIQGSSPAVADGKVFIGSHDNCLYALDQETGELIWKYKTGHWIDSSPAVADGAVYVGSLDGKLYAFGPAALPPNQPPTCSIELRKYNVKIDEIDVGEFFDINVSDSTDDTGIKQVRFSSDEFQDGNPTGEWTDWYDWDNSFGDWNASTKIKRWAFTTGGDKEVWAEVKDDIGQTANCSTNIYANETREMKIVRLITEQAIGGVPVTVDGQYYIILTLKSYIDPITLEVMPNVMTKVYVGAAENYPVSEPEIARKIGLIDYARSLQQGTGSPESIAQKSQYLIYEWLAYREVEFEDEAVEIIGNWFSAIPGLGWLMDEITSKIKQLTWDPINEVRDIANRDIQRALDMYVSAQRIATNEISDYDVAYTYLKNLWEGEVYQNIGTSLLYKINEVGKSKLERIKDYFVREIVTELLDRIFAGSAELVVEFIEMDLEAVDATRWADEYEQEKSREMSSVEFKLLQQLWGASGYTLELAQTPRIAAEVHSPVELRVYDSQGRVTGVVNGEEKNEIPYSTYYENTVMIFSPNDSYHYEVVSTNEGSYSFTVINVTEQEIIAFNATDIPTTPEAVHQYTINWTALSQGEEGVTAQIDSDGDGVFEHTFTSDSELTQREYVIGTDKIPPQTSLNIGEPKFVADDVTYLTSATPMALIAEDNLSGSGVASTAYRIHNATWDSGWITYTQPFYLTELSDGTYQIDYNSTDNARNVEPTNIATVILDNTPPTTTISIGEPKYVNEITYVTPDTPFILEADDAGSGVYLIAYRISNGTYDSGWLPYTAPFYLTSLTDGVYTIEFNSTDNLGNIEATNSIQVTLFSWNYVFTDSYGRGTTLKINTQHEFFQFITPDNGYGIRNATYMQVCNRTIIILHKDNELRLITLAVDTKLDFCVAIAWDVETRTRYFLIDRVGIEN